MLEYAGESPPPLSADGWLVTGDLVRVDGDRVYFQGRTDDVLNVGGAKVYPQEVEDFLLSCPGVTEVRVRSVPNPVSGQLLAADVVLAHGYEPDRHRVELMRLCQATLASHKAPRLIRIVPEIQGAWPPGRRPDRMPSRKHVIVTGGSRGLGEAIVRRMLAKEYRVSTCSRSKTSFIDEMMAPPRLWRAVPLDRLRGRRGHGDRPSSSRKPWPGPAATDCMAW